jgi:hypothetical protein
MSRPALTLESLVIRPGYAEAMSMLVGQFKKTGATLPQLVESIHSTLGKPGRLVSVWLLHRLKRLAAERLVRYVPFAPEFLREHRKDLQGRRGRQPSGKWVITEYGADYWDARLSVEIAKKMAGTVLSTPDERKHVTQVATPTVLIVNLEPVRKNFLGLRKLLEGPSIGLTNPARETALQVWAQNPRIAADWKALQTLRRRFPKDTSKPYTIPEWLALKAWHPAVRRAHRKVEKHTIVIGAEVNPAYWDDLPIERLEAMRSEYLAQERVRRSAEARIRRRTRDEAAGRNEAASAS